VWVVDTNKEHLAVDEARKLGVPVVAILDTNCDPDLVDYQIPGNDDAIRSVALLTRVIADAVADGLMARHSQRAAATEGEAPAEAEPLAEWERELLAGAEAPAAEAAAEPVVEAPVAEAEVAAEPTAAEATEEPAVADSTEA
jgi:small subunit ribosomal protein S2